MLPPTDGGLGVWRFGSGTYALLRSCVRLMCPRAGGGGGSAGTSPVRWRRDRLIYPKRWWYYVAMVADVLGRFTWSLQLSPHWWFLGSVGRELQMFVLEAVEILRRCMWIFFRCEWQYVHNIGKDGRC